MASQPSGTFFYFFLLCFATLILSILLFIAAFLRFKPYCSCQICRSYLKSTWSLHFPNLCDWYAHLLAKSPTGTISVHVLGNVITADPENVEYILKTRFENYPKGEQFSALLGDLLGRGIFNVDGDLWKFQRKIASLELGSVAVRSYAFDVVASEIQSMLIPVFSSSSGSGTLIDLQEVFRRFSFNCICRFSFGIDPCSLRGQDFAAAFDLASRLSAQRAVSPWQAIWKLKRFFNLGSEKELRFAIKAVRELAEEVIKHKRNLKHLPGESRSNDLLSRFMSTIDDDGFLRNVVVSFLLAGRDTVAAALTTFFFLLSQNPQSIDLIRQESDVVLGTNGAKTPTFADLWRMHYLHAAVHESLRLCPPVQFDSKFCRNDDVLPDGTVVRKGTRVTYHCYAMGRMERVWGPDCLEFKPDRWLHDGRFRMEDPFKYPVFHAGPRLCLGMEMAVTEMKAVAVAVLRKFDIEVPGSGLGRGPIFVPGLTASVRGGLSAVVRELRN